MAKFPKKISDNLTVDVVNQVFEIGSNLAKYGAERERTEQVKAECYVRCKESDDKLSACRENTKIKLAENEIEKRKIDLAATAQQNAHKSWCKEFERDEKALGILRKKMEQGTLTERDWDTFDKLSMKDYK